jgi:transposase
MKSRHQRPNEIAVLLARAEKLALEGLTAREIVQILGVGRATLARWKSKFSGASAEQIERVKKLEKQNRRLLRAAKEYRAA